ALVVGESVNDKAVIIIEVGEGIQAVEDGGFIGQNRGSQDGEAIGGCFYFAHGAGQCAVHRQGVGIACQAIVINRAYYVHHHAQAKIRRTCLGVIDPDGGVVLVVVHAVDDDAAEAAYCATVQCLLAGGGNVGSGGIAASTCASASDDAIIVTIAAGGKQCGHAEHGGQP